MKYLSIIVIAFFISSPTLFAYTIYAETYTAELYENCKMYTTFFWHDNDTPSDPTDDINLGIDVIIKCPENVVIDPKKIKPEQKKFIPFDEPFEYFDYLKYLEEKKEKHRKLKTREVIFTKQVIGKVKLKKVP